jgi:F-type H+-transporting ATPase subunit b
VLDPFMTHRYRRAIAVLLVAMALVALVPLTAVTAAQADPAATAAVHDAPPSDIGASEHDATAHDAGWLPVIAKVVNFALLVWVLIYFLKAPLAQHLNGRSTSIRKDLADARSVRAAAEGQLAAVRGRLAELPGELAALEAHGREALASEQERLKAATAHEREHLLERTHREIDMQVQAARRELTQHTANLAMSLARTRIERTMTPDDQARLIDRYATEVHG